MKSDANLTGCPAGNRFVPFLKWAGGKRWFVSRHLDMAPDNFKRYIEPFLGGGAVFFALQPKFALLSDLNSDLINCYRAVSESPILITEQLLKHHNAHTKDYYYRMRSKKPTDSVERASWFIYLNRTCWNGLYRVNKMNEFNVPMGSKENVVLPADDFLKISQLLSCVEILCQDFENTIETAEENDFVFVDPPYTVNHNLNGFLKFNDKIFSWADQVRLRNAVERASNRGAKVLITNANHVSVREIYSGVGRFDVVNRASVLAADANHRMKTEELVVRTWLES